VREVVIGFVHELAAVVGVEVVAAVAGGVDGLADFGAGDEGQEGGVGHAEEVGELGEGEGVVKEGGEELVEGADHGMSTESGVHL
jgi:hypothetical protein